jgi:ComF family protein
VRLPSLVRDVLDFCYPGRCACCGADTAGGAQLCTDCDADLRKLESAAGCSWCGKPLMETGAPCPYCLGEGIPHFDRVIRLGVFEEPLKHLIHQMKYHNRWGLGEVLADRLLGQEKAKALLTETEVIVAVPLHRLRQISRGYNQAEVIGKRLARGRGLRLARPVVRLRHTESQTNLTSAAKREENLRDAFGLVNPKPVRGKHVIVVDDVMTTGATLKAVARALRVARPASLSAVVLAVADPKGRDFQSI